MSISTRVARSTPVARVGHVDQDDAAVHGGQEAPGFADAAGQGLAHGDIEAQGLVAHDVEQILVHDGKAPDPGVLGLALLDPGGIRTRIHHLDLLHDANELAVDGVVIVHKITGKIRG